MQHNVHVVGEQAARVVVAQIAERVVHQGEAQAGERRAVVVGGVQEHLMLGEQQLSFVVVVAREPGRVEADDVDRWQVWQGERLPIPQEGVPVCAAGQELRALDALQERAVAALALGGAVEAVHRGALWSGQSREPIIEAGLIAMDRCEGPHGLPGVALNGALNVMVPRHKEHTVPAQAEERSHIVEPLLGLKALLVKPPVSEVTREHEQVRGPPLHDLPQPLLQRRPEHPVSSSAAKPDLELAGVRLRRFAVLRWWVHGHPLMQIREVQNPQGRGLRRGGHHGSQTQGPTSVTQQRPHRTPPPPRPRQPAAMAAPPAAPAAPALP